MAFKVYLSYSLEPTEFALAWRLQTLATAYGIEMYVPTYDQASPSVKAAVLKALDKADCVLAIITTDISRNVQNELGYALERRKLVVPIVRSDVPDQPFLAQFSQVFRFSPLENPGGTETEIMNFLKHQQIAKENQQAIGALAAVGLGLLVLVALGNKE